MIRDSMPSIRAVRTIGPRAPDAASGRRHEFVSPNGQWSAVYHSPREFHMGADGWRLRLRYKGLAVGWRHAAIRTLAGATGFRCEADLQPWSHDSALMALLTWDAEPVHLYAPSSKTVRQLAGVSGFVYSLQWSPSLDRLLLTWPEKALLADRRGALRQVTPWRVASGERPDTAWTTDGHWFFVVARDSIHAPVMLTFYDGETGARAEAFALDPHELVPYDADAFSRIARDRFSLVVSPSIGAAGHLLDTWHGVGFDRPSSTLFLAVYRPVSAVYTSTAPPYGSAGGAVCDVDERWIAVEIGP